MKLVNAKGAIVFSPTAPNRLRPTRRVILLTGNYIQSGIAVPTRRDSATALEVFVTCYFISVCCSDLTSHFPFRLTKVSVTRARKV